MEEQKQYREDLLAWCNNIYSNWNSMKPKASMLCDGESLEKWEGSCLQLKEKLQADSRADFDDYQTAKSLYEQWERLFKETNADQEEMEADLVNRLELEEQQQLDEEYLETDDDQEEIEFETDECMELEEQQQYREELLEWCNNIYANWESMKPRFSQLFERESLEEWEGSCLKLKEKLQADARADFDDYQTAKSLYDQWEQLFKESSAYNEEIGV